MEIKKVIFDFDGVIVDSRELMLELIHNFLPDFTNADLGEFMDGNVYSPLNAKLHQALRDSGYDFFGNYKNYIIKTKPVEGIAELLNKLEKIVVVTSNSEEVVQAYLSKYNLSNNVERILGMETNKSKVSKFEMLIKELPVDKWIFVTDTLGDILESKEVGIEVVAVTWGFQKREKLTLGKPDMIVDTVNELTEILNN